MELLKNFGVEPELLVSQIVNFLIISYLLKRFAYKPILQVLKNREKAITEGMRQAEEAQVLLDKASQKEKEILKQAQAEVKKLMQETRNQGDMILKQAEEAARKQAEQILKEARQQIASETKETQKLLSMQISGLAVEFIQKSVAYLFSKEDQELIIKNVVSKMKKRVD